MRKQQIDAAENLDQDTFAHANNIQIEAREAKRKTIKSKPITGCEVQRAYITYTRPNPCDSRPAAPSVGRAATARPIKRALNALAISVCHARSAPEITPHSRDRSGGGWVKKCNDRTRYLFAEALLILIRRARVRFWIATCNCV